MNQIGGFNLSDSNENRNFLPYLNQLGYSTKSTNNNENSNDGSLSSPKYSKYKQKLESCYVIPGHLINFDSQLNNDATKALTPDFTPICTEAIDSEMWIKKYGLKANKLTFENILNKIGFKQIEDYLQLYKKQIMPKYAKGLFLQTQSREGLTYNITVDETKLIEFTNRLEDAIKMFRLRLQWLNSDSRRLFGVVAENNICIVLDCKQKDLIQFSQYRNCVIKLIREQIAKLSSFNLIRCSTDDIESFRDKAVAVSVQTIDDALEWLNEWNRNFVKGSTETSTCEGVLKAFQDKSIEAVYLISEGVSSNGTRELLYDKMVKESFNKQIKLNVISYNCNDSETVEYLRRLATNSYGPGRFHAYCLLRQMDDYTPGPIDPDPTKNKVILNKRCFGGAPPGSGVKSDLMIVFEEIQIARDTLDNLKELISSMEKANRPNRVIQPSSRTNDSTKQEHKDEEYLASKEWLKKHGLAARKIEIFDVLNQVSFRHCDGVVDIKKEPSTGRVFLIGDGKRYNQGDAIPREKLVNAKYCDQFAHVLWFDGTIMHVHVTPELHRNYEQRVNTALNLYEKRIDWLSRGSRELFGTVIEKNICILIDTSQSMQISLDFVKKKLAILMQEQLRCKQRFNIVAYNSKIYPWRDRMVEVDQFNMNNALEWINGLSAQGTTNTLGAIKFALADLNTEAIYLLSDGRPDQDPRRILSQVHLNTKIPIHTISFNCNDAEANRFLSQLARETTGRYHYFNENGWDADPEGPVPYESEDTSLLKKEIERGQRFLAQVTSLRNECSEITRNSQSIYLSKNSYLRETANSVLENVGANESNEYKFVSKYRSKSSFNLSKSSDSNKQGVLSILYEIQTLDWILPETRELLERQYRNEFVKRPKRNLKKDMETSISLKQQIKRKFSLNEENIKKWLQRNSLTALKLTILNALEPCITPNKSYFSSNSALDENEINVLDDYVDSKVWKEILEFAHVSNSGVKHFKLLNPEAINLEIYERKLENQIKVYRKFLARRIWSGLSKIDKDYYKLPFEFDDSNREDLLKKLEDLNWPVAKRDIELVEEEINLAKVFLRQSRDLSAYLKSKKQIQLSTPVQAPPSSSAPASAPATPKSSRLSNRSRTRSSSSSSSSASASESSSYSPHSASHSVSAKLSVQLNMKDEEKQISRGDKVIARNDLVGYYYSGKVTRLIGSRHANVKFENGIKQSRTSFRNIIKLPRITSYLYLGDYVMANVLNEFNERCWVPGIIQSIDAISFPKMFTVLFFNGEEGENIRTELIKINKNIYGFIVNFVRSKLSRDSHVIAKRKEEKPPEPPPPEPRPPSPPFQPDELKKEIVDSIKSHFDSLKLDEKYQKMYDEFSSIKKKQKELKRDLGGKLRLVRKDFDEYKHQPVPFNVLPAPSPIIIERRRTPSPKPPTPPPPKPEPILTYEQKIVKLRKDLPDLSIGEEVLAKWPDDGWYYRSIVKDYLGNGLYIIEDSLKDSENIYREDIISEICDSNDSFETGDPVVALHPHYEFSYAPGQIIQLSNDMNRMKVRFYDYVECVVNRDDVYKLHRIKFQYDVEKINELERKWIGKTVVGRNDYSNFYELGKIIDRVGNGRQYIVEWSNGKQSLQNANHIFGAYTRKLKIIVNDYVIAPKETIFLPGRVIGRKAEQLRIEFVDGVIDENISYEDCYWISRDYYEDACNFYKREIDQAEFDLAESSKIYKKKDKNERDTPVIETNENLTIFNYHLYSYF